MYTNTVRWGLVGCGWVARDYVAPGIVAAPHAELVAVCDPDQQARGHIAAQSGNPKQYVDAAALLADDEIDAVYIATPNHLHRQLTVTAAQASKHVLCEKPMATTLADATAMVSVCAAAGVRYATAFDQRFQGYHRRLRDLVAAGALGTITATRVHYACWTPGDWQPETSIVPHDNWRIDPQRAGGGALIDLAPHGIDLVQYLLDSELVEIASMLQRQVFDYQVDDGAVLMGRFANGALATFNVAYNCPDAFPRRTLELVGTRAMALAHNTMGQTPGGTLRLVTAEGEQHTVELEAGEDVSPFQMQIDIFSRCLLDNVPFPFSPERDLHTMRLIDVAQRIRG